MAGFNFWGALERSFLIRGGGGGGGGGLGGLGGFFFGGRMWGGYVVEGLFFLNIILKIICDYKYKYILFNINKY